MPPTNIEASTLTHTTAQVALPLPIDQTFSYAIPPDLQDQVQPGCRVVVPFGSRILTGVVVSCSNESGELKEILDLLDETPALTPELLRLTQWIASYYLCSWGEAIRAALPSGTEIESRRMVFPIASSSQHPVEAAILTYLHQQGPATPERLRQALGKEVTLYRLHRMQRQGAIRISQSIVSPRVTIKKVACITPDPAFATPEALLDLAAHLKGPRQRALLTTLAELLQQGEIAPPRSRLLRLAGASTSTLHSLIRRGILRQIEQEVSRQYATSTAPPPRNVTFHPEQQAAIDAIIGALDRQAYQTFLLHGITGSGKTEVYIQALKHARSLKKTGIVLVPEIALTPQTVQRFRSHFHDEVAVFHSRMSAGERYDTWRKIRDGTFSIVIGPRSAILAPLENIGLIVVDEEHEPSYKQFDPAPRYHARDVAIMRAYMNQAVCILGSATPSIESFVNAQRGKYRLLEMRHRVPVTNQTKAHLPEVHLVDLRVEKKKRRLHGVLSETLCEAIEHRLSRQEQVILFQNRRGYAPVVTCESCGWSPECSSCAVTLTYHRSHHQLRCHYCGRAQPMPSHCPACQTQALLLLGAGTQRVEEELRQRFPEARIARMDLDTTSKKHAHKTLLKAFERGEIDILLGTQMVAKGLDFERVTLVGVINADTSLLLPDFRAGERTFQLLTQVAGRAGRSTLKGEVFIQTRMPEHPSIQCAAMHDYHRFVQHELPERQAFGYPPFGYLIGFSFQGPKEKQTESIALQFYTRLQQVLDASVQLLGPEQAFIRRIKGQYRYHILLKAPLHLPRQLTKQRIRTLIQEFSRLPRGVRLIIDVDPMTFF